MSAFGHAGFGSSNRRNQLRAQGQIGADTYGQGVRNAMQAPTLNIYNAPQTYQQATGQPTAAPQTNQPSTSVSQPAPPVYQTDNEQPDMQTYKQPTSPGTAQPIQPQSQGTPYQAYSIDSANQSWSNMPAGSQQLDWIGNTIAKMDPAVQYQQALNVLGIAPAAEEVSPVAQQNEQSNRFTGEVPQDYFSLTQDQRNEIIERENQEAKARIALANSGALGRYIGDGQYELDHMFQGYGGQIRYTDPGVSLSGLRQYRS